MQNAAWEITKNMILLEGSTIWQKINVPDYLERGFTKVFLDSELINFKFLKKNDMDIILLH